MTDKNEKSREQITSKIWREETEADNPFTATKSYCPGFDVYSDLLGKISLIEYLWLLFKLDQLSKAQARILEGLVLANLGPHDYSARGTMNAGIGGSTRASALIAAISTDTRNGSYLKLAFKIEEHFKESRDKYQINTVTVSAALFTDGEILPNEKYYMATLAFVAGIYPCYIDSVDKPERAIKELGATDIDEIPETAPAQHIARNGIGYQPIYIFRGISSNFNPQVLVLINSIPVTNLFDGDRNVVWGGMPVEAIARIEVIRGPGSAIYGADTFAGTINIITKKGEQIDDTKIGVRSGNLNTTDIWIQTSKELGALNLNNTLEFHNTDGSHEKINSESQSIIDELSGTNASLSPGSVSQIALARSAQHNLTVKTLYGEAFRATSFMETGEQANPAFLGNLDLEPETLKSYKLAFNYKPSYDLTLEFNLFKYYSKDIIQFVPRPNGQPVPAITEDLPLERRRIYG